MLFSAVLLASTNVKAEDIPVRECRYAGPFKLERPVMMDSVNLKGKNFSEDDWVQTPLNLSLVDKGKNVSEGELPGCSDGAALHLLGFQMENSSFTEAEIQVEGLHSYRLYIDQNEYSGGKTALQPASHRVVVKYLSQPGQKDSLRIQIKTDRDGVVAVNEWGGKRLYTLQEVLLGKRYSRMSVSPDGRYAIVTYSITREGGSTDVKSKLWDLQQRKVIANDINGSWMPKSNCYYSTRRDEHGKSILYATDPRTGEERILAENFPLDGFRISPTEDYVIIIRRQEGQKEKNSDVFEVVEPEDRQPGWRDRNQLLKYDLATGLCTPITFGYHDVYLNDISNDGRYLLVGKSESRLTQRPTTVQSIYRIDLQTMGVDTLVVRDGFIGSALFSPDGKQVLISGSPEAFGGVGNVVPEGRVPSMIDMQLYLMDIDNLSNDSNPTARRRVKPLTRQFYPNVSRYVWSKADGMVYFNAEDKDCMHLFQLNPKDGKIRRIDTPEEMVMNFSVASAAPTIAFYGQGASNSDRLYSLSTKTLKSNLLEDLSAERLKDVQLGECTAWTYLNERGDTICCRYYLPPHFDPAKKYPMIVNYYGGCSPTSRNFESRYPQHAYAALDYVVLIVNPSGATGFGQEFSSRHVNTAGKGVAEDIIGATKQFCAEHAWVNKDKIGCIGASYGGFMTQYLQTQTDIFAAAISHAGISDHTSYWGEGYWGYSYSEVSMANSYPWTDKQLYVDQSPLFNADKIHTPLLFLHGTADTNVPVGESIQMYTALKLLGRPTAMVLVQGENHHILDYDKRVQWQNTIFAWFDRWLKDEPEWWKSMYDDKSL